jgi:hypothetical protein
MTEEYRCCFNEAWAGRCKNTGTGNPPLCDSHRAQTCWCGAQAFRNCSITSSVVCGQPLCNDHLCHKVKVAAGMTGSDGMRHSEHGHAQYVEWGKQQHLP